jgi:BirA family biotin operon repressor/biotin-[acetyl-CoA-carboxylase] ligase
LNPQLISQSLNTLFTGRQLVHLPHTQSTNNELIHKYRAGEVLEGCLLTTNFQEQGRGQAGNAWYASAGKNILMSILYQPTFLPPSSLFYFNKMVAIALRAALQKFVSAKVCIKWPNDIYVNQKKVAGVLIENGLKGATVGNSIVGIGVNVNETEFPRELQHATSLSVVNNKSLSLEQVMAEVCNSIEKHYLIFKKNGIGNIDEVYHEHLYRRGSWHSFLVMNQSIRACIQYVNEQGQLVVMTADGALTRFDIKEIKFEN